MKKISFIIPCYNSEKTIEIVVSEIVDVISIDMRFDYEIILINDASLDNTLKVIRKLCDLNSKIIGLNLSKNFGQPSATLAGCDICSGDIIVYSDDDGQTPINEVTK